MQIKANRPWFQIRLSTALVMMFAAGGVGAITLGGRSIDKAPPVEGAIPYRCAQWGWPMTIQYGDVFTYDWTSKSWSIADPIFGNSEKGLSVSSLLVDVIITLLLSAVSGAFFELLIRWFDAKAKVNGSVQVGLLVFAGALICSGDILFRQLQANYLESYNVTMKIVNHSGKAITVECQPFVDHDGRIYDNNRKKTLRNNQEWNIGVNIDRAYWIISYFEPLNDRSRLSVFVRPPIGSSYLAVSFGHEFEVLPDCIKYNNERW